jgi:outer membrane protein
MKKLLLVLVSIFIVGAINAQVKIAYVNSNKVLDTLPSRKAAVKELQEFSAAADKELTDLDTELQKAYEKYVKERESLSAVLRQYEEERIQKMQTNIQTREQELQQRLQQRNNDLNAPVLKILQTAVENVSERKKLNYVMDETQLLYSKGGTDITAEVIDEALKLDATKK